jgi:hypothetical protein
MKGRVSMPDAQFTNTEGQEFTVSKDEKYIIYIQGDTRMIVDKDSGGNGDVRFASRAERDRAVRTIRGDHPVYDRDDPNTRI